MISLSNVKNYAQTCLIPISARVAYATRWSIDQAKITLPLIGKQITQTSFKLVNKGIKAFEKNCSLLTFGIGVSSSSLLAQRIIFWRGNTPSMTDAPKRWVLLLGSSLIGGFLTQKALRSASQKLDAYCSALLAPSPPSALEDHWVGPRSSAE